ncbi:MAG: methyltransferase domain-containing protein [Chloroflexi bacterium]|nr:methyltransferase domain-containing protein [Chloroflexota bacterium]
MTIQAAFDAAATTYDSLRRILIPCFDDFYRTAVEQLPFPADSPIEVLDLGAGTGLMSAWVRAAFPNARLTLADIADAMLERARERFEDDTIGVRFIALDYAESPLIGRYDAVVSALSIHHLEGPAKAALFRRVFAALKPGGVFVNADQALGATPELERRYREAWLRQVQENGVPPEELHNALERMKFDRMSPLADQLAWLEDAGFENVDCWFKDYSFVVFSGERPGG